MSTYNRTRKGLDPGPTDHYRRRQRRRSTKGAKPIDGTPVGQPTLGQVADRESLINTCYDLKSRGGQAPGREGARGGHEKAAPADRCHSRPPWLRAPRGASLDILPIIPYVRPHSG